MTIALGFLYQRGVLVCADTQFTAGGAKLDGNKTGRISASWGQVVAAFCGNVDYASSLFYEVDHLKETKPYLDDPLQAIRKALRGHYKAHVFSHPDRATGDYDYSFLFGLYLNGKPEEGARFYKTNEGAIRQLSAFECCGIGEQFGRDLLRNLHRRKMEHAGAVALAAYVVSHAGHRAQYVSDKLAIQVLNHDGTVLEASESQELNCLVGHMNSVGNWFVLECQKFLLSHTAGTDDEFAYLLQVLASRVAHMREIWASILEAQRSPKSTTADPSPLLPWPESPGGFDES